jgi:hypothetical protein
VGSRDHSITCATCGYQRGGLNDDKCKCDIARSLVAAVTFDKQAARAAMKAFEVGQLSALMAAGQLPGAVKRVDALEDACRACLGIIDGVEQPGTTLQVVAALLRSVLSQDKTETKP